MTPEERAKVDAVTEALTEHLVWTHGADGNWGQRFFEAVYKYGSKEYLKWTSVPPEADVLRRYPDMPRIIAVKVYPDGRVCGKLK